MENGDIPASVVPEIPLGMYPGKLDDKGRLKLAAPFIKFLSSLSDKRLFVTSLDRQSAVIYPIAAWRDNAELLDNCTDDPEAAEITLFTAQDLGAEDELDGQGRVTLNSQLRKELSLEKTELHVFGEKGHIKIVSDVEYQRRLNDSRSKAAGAAAAMKKLGLK